AFAEVYLALQQGTVDGQENPLPTIMAKKFYEVQSHIMLTGHITESLITIVGGHVWSKMSDADKKVFEEVLKEANARSTDQIRASELKLADEFRKLGKTVVEVDREAFRKAAVPLHNDASAGAGWSKAEYDALQALKYRYGQVSAPRLGAARHRPRSIARGIMNKQAAPDGEKRLIEVEDAEVKIEHYPEDWIAFVIFWSLAFIVFLQFFTRYVLNDSLSWTEEIARYGLMWVVFIGGAMVTR